MASSTTNNSKEIAAEIPTVVRVYKDGTVERLRESPFVPPSLDDPQLTVSSKDTLISHEPSISARLYLPKHTHNNKLPILVYFHGGGFLFESAFSQSYHSHFNCFVSQVDVIVVSVEYRLAPEHPLPAAYHDCWASLQWVAAHYSSPNPPNKEPWLINHGDFSRVFLGGDSAGGNIVHNMLMRAGSETLPASVKVLGAFLSHPFFYGSQPIGSEQAIATPDYMLKVWNFVFPCAPGGIDCPMINPMADGAPTLAGLGCSKMLICVAGKDKLRDRGIWYYDAVKNSGWLGELDLYEETQEDHVYHIHNPQSHAAFNFVKRLSSFLLG
ncbi:hypothetical protein HN51_007527 [Arachis hypogaea]|uniref:Alpha/beta hydrolase fold-3 domain-containing protein n=2 Tax=Arachis TaxID=3817 RepID=A0A445D7L9_ARAHY|nr:2-hydroxyisoflavanone dehydratase-like [Arachis duranensis]XP_025699669.1 2-hydroxyisoflavanone dehydratase [Arachis hypogaea]XP_057759447.1 2-hydroxyisoflavanone dehydratase-like [Arachis stenosperma]QHO41678.1 2-hydroxyisoflavanone dehydratase [Arachis hypogaea]RYR59158.1 hypothetical protein Ahy_A05g024993 [Arachis hypogaea]